MADTQVSNFYKQLMNSIAEAEHVANATADNGGDPGHAQAMIQIVIAKTLVDIAENLDHLRQVYRVPGE